MKIKNFNFFLIILFVSCSSKLYIYDTSLLDNSVTANLHIAKIPDPYINISTEETGNKLDLFVSNSEKLSQINDIRYNLKKYNLRSIVVSLIKEKHYFKNSNLKIMINPNVIKMKFIEKDIPGKILKSNPAISLYNFKDYNKIYKERYIFEIKVLSWGHNDTIALGKGINLKFSAALYDTKRNLKLWVYNDSVSEPYRVFLGTNASGENYRLVGETLKKIADKILLQIRKHILYK